MISKSTLSIFLTSVIFVASFSHFADAATTSRPRCTDDELDEAQKSFRNCVDSAKAGIVTRHGAQTSQNGEVEETKETTEVVPPLCDELDTMLMGCEAEVDALSQCKGRRHVENLKAIHLSSIADVLKALNDDLNVDDCDVFKRQPEVDDEDEGDEPEVHQFPESGPESISRATSMTSSIVFVVFVSVLRLL